MFGAPGGSVRAMAYVDLHWVPLGAGGPKIVRATGRVYRALTGAAPYHSALTAEVDGVPWTIEVAPSPDENQASRGVVATGAVGARLAGRLRVFRYEVRCWRDGIIPDLDHAVARIRLTEDPDTVRRVLELVRSVPTPVWGLRWNSNSMVAWVLSHAGLAEGITPPPGGRAPGWDAGNY